MQKIQCAGCGIPLPTSCKRNKLSTKFSSLGLQTCDSSILEIFSQFFKLRQTVINGLNVSLKDLELCRFCTSNFSQLVKVYQKILQVSNETGSTFSRIIVHGRGRPGRPKNSKNHNAAAETSTTTPVNSSVPGTSPDFEEEEEEEAPLGLQYLGLSRKRKSVPPIKTSVGSKRPRRGKSINEPDTEVLFPEELDEIANELNNGDYTNPSNAKKDISKEKSIEENGELSSDSTPISCKYCDKNFKHPQRLKQHLKTHHETLSHDSDQVFNNNVDDHEEVGEELESKQKRKPRNIKTSTIRTVTSVKKRGRPPKSPLKSSRPPSTKSSTSTSPDKKSKKAGVQKEDFNHTCKVCKKKFRQLQLLNQHMKIHVNDKKCQECDKKFKNAALLKRHSLIHKKDNTVFKCEDCEREFPNLLGLQVHAVSHTRQLYTCKGCKRKFKIEKNFIQHQETARCTEKKHPCPVETCGKLFKNKDKVKRHLISMHSEKKPFGCDLCGKGFRSQADLKFHEVNAHICGEAKQYVCDQCGKRFKSLETLKSHEQYSHKMEKKHFCSQCGKGFPLLATLKIHEISHSTDRPHLCTYCGRCYKHANDLRSHEVVHYRDEEKPFECPICGKRYHRKDVLRLHQGREKHFAPDVPVPAATRKLAKSKQTSSAKEQKIIDADQDFDSGESNSSLGSSPPLSSSQAGPSGVSVVQNLSTNPHSHVVFSQTNQLNPGMLIPTPANPTSNQHHHLVPIMHHSNVNAGHHQQQQHGNIPQPPFTPVNEAISDFYRIMYDLS